MKIFQNPKKSLGQNFLIDKNIIAKIVKAGNIDKDTVVLEIGAGYGNLTEEIISHNPKKIFVVEKDNKLASFLLEKYKKYKNVKVINQDILDIIKKENSEKNVTVFGNLPYNISTQILSNLITLKKWPPWYTSLTLMFQKEVANRIIAREKTKDFGRLAILANWRLEVNKNFNISKNSFFPKPKIDSTLLSFKPKKNNKFNLQNPKNLEEVTRILFSNRRKMINKNYNILFKNNQIVAEKLKINLKKRPEELKLETFYKMAVFYEKLFG